MPFINTIVNHINNSLNTGTLSKSLFQPAVFYNIASQISAKEDPAVMFPGVINFDGEIVPCQPDDSFTVSIYHKVISNIYSASKKGYGDGIDIVSQTEMQLFVFGQSDKMKLSAEMLEPFILFGMPSSISGDMAADLKVKACYILPLSSDMDKIRNFKNEFPGHKFFLKPEDIFFSIRYQVKMQFDRDCIDACLC